MNMTRIGPYRYAQSRCVACILLVSTCFSSGVLRAQAPAAAPTIQTLKILPLTNGQPFNELETGLMAPLAVQVLDQNDRPVEDATVTFRFPLEGASARFAAGETAQTVRTSATGQARATGWTANDRVGSFRVQVTALRGNEQGTAAIPLTNVDRLPEDTSGGHWWSSTWAKILYVAGAAAAIAVIVLATQGSDSTTITGVPGTPTIGGPQ